MLVVADDALDTFEGHYDQIIDLIEALGCFLCPVHCLQIKFEVLRRPFATMISTIFLTIFLNGDIGQMHKHIVHFSNIRRIQLIAESSETFVINIRLDGPIGGDKYCK